MLTKSFPLLSVLLAALPTHATQFGESASSDQFRFWVDDGFNQMTAQFSTEPFNGINTFAKLPYENCFLNETTPASRYDIAILGAPHDTVVLPPPH